MHEVKRKKMISSRVAVQRHHDYYVTLERLGRLTTDAERKQYGLAMRREHTGEVSPIPEDQE